MTSARPGGVRRNRKDAFCAGDANFALFSPVGRCDSARFPVKKDAILANCKLRLGALAGDIRPTGSRERSRTRQGTRPLRARTFRSASDGSLEPPGVQKRPGAWLSRASAGRQLGESRMDHSCCRYCGEVNSPEKLDRRWSARISDAKAWGPEMIGTKYVRFLWQSHSGFSLLRI